MADTDLLLSTTDVEHIIFLVDNIQQEMAELRNAFSECQEFRRGTFSEIRRLVQDELESDDDVEQTTESDDDDVLFDSLETDFHEAESADEAEIFDEAEISPATATAFLGDGNSELQRLPDFTRHGDAVRDQSTPFPLPVENAPPPFAPPVLGLASTREQPHALFFLQKQSTAIMARQSSSPPPCSLPTCGAPPGLVPASTLMSCATPARGLLVLEEQGQIVLQVVDKMPQVLIIFVFDPGGTAPYLRLSSYVMPRRNILECNSPEDKGGGVAHHAFDETHDYQNFALTAADARVHQAWVESVTGFKGGTTVEGIVAFLLHAMHKIGTCASVLPSTFLLSTKAMVATTPSVPSVILVHIDSGKATATGHLLYQFGGIDKCVQEAAEMNKVLQDAAWDTSFINNDSLFFPFLETRNVLWGEVLL